MIKQTWEEEFDEKFIEYFKNISIGQYDDNNVNIGFKKPNDLIKSFIKQTRLSLIEEIEKEIEKKKMKETGLEISGIYNSAINEVLQLLNNIKENEK